MFLSHIALALELISLAVGAILVLKCCVSCCLPHVRDVRAEHLHTETTSEKTPRKSHGHFGFLKFIGYLVIILSFLALICTAISTICHVNKYGFADVVYPAYKSKNLERNEERLEPYHKMVPPVPETENP